MVDVWILVNVIKDIPEHDACEWEICGVFDSEAQARDNIRPGERLLKLPLNKRLPDETMDYEVQFEHEQR